MDYACHIVIMVALFSILAISFNLLVGFAGILALAQAVFYAGGAYVTGLASLRLGLPFPVTTLASILVTAGFGTLITLPALRISGEHLIIVTLALQVIVGAALLNLTGLTGGTDGLRGIAPVDLFGWRLTHTAAFAVLAVAAAIMAYAFAARLAASPFGRALEAMRENELAVASIGKNVVYLKTVCFAVSAGLAALAGSLYAHYFTFVSPGSFTINQTIYILAMVAVGGRGNLLGSVVGAALLVGLPEALKLLDLPTDVADRGRDILYGLVLIAILRVRPQGILGRRRLAVAAARSVRHDWRGMVPPPGAGSGEVTLSGEGLRRSFGGIVAVADLTIVLRSGRISGLIGPNGAGKTTAFNILTGFLAPDSGQLALRGVPIRRTRPHQIVRQGIARSFQDLRLFTGLTVLENVLVAVPGQAGDDVASVFLRPGAVARSERAAIAKALGVLGFIGLAGKSGEDVGNLSYAEEKLLVIARLIATEAEILLFDEPLSGLDPTTLAKMIPLVRSLAAAGRTVCIIEHNLEVISSLCDDVFFLDEGRVVAHGAPAELMGDPELAARYFG